MFQDDTCESFHSRVAALRSPRQSASRARAALARACGLDADSHDPETTVVSRGRTGLLGDWRVSPAAGSREPPYQLSPLLVRSSVLSRELATTVATVTSRRIVFAVVLFGARSAWRVREAAWLKHTGTLKHIVALDDDDAALQLRQTLRAAASGQQKGSQDDDRVVVVVDEANFSGRNRRLAALMRGCVGVRVVHVTGVGEGDD